MATEAIDDSRDDLYQYYVGWFALLAILLYLYRQQNAQYLAEDTNKPTALTSGFKRFQRLYIAVYLIMMAADWMQGPYVYALYKHYGYEKQQIGVLFIAGFGASLVFGTVVGSMADKYGRKTICLAFGVMYSISCLTKHSPDFNYLMFGRILGGISTSILFSAFESWMVHEHHDASYPEEWLGITFSLCTSGNGIIAILSGVVASFARDNLGPVAPFDVSLLFLIVGSCLIAFFWKENYGDSRIDMGATFSNAWGKVLADRKVLLLGVIQSFFEGTMYIFVFMWTPALESTSNREIFHGWIFASFMLCVLFGSTVFNVLLKQGLQVERFAVYIFVVSAVALFSAAFVQHHTLRLMAFCVFEVCCGLFWPSLGFMRSRYVPEEVRSTVMNFFRIPLNCIVVLVLFNIGSLSEFAVFMLCTMLLIPSIVCQLSLIKLTVDSPDIGTEQDTELEDHRTISNTSGH